MSDSYSVSFTTNYNGTDFTRTYEISDLAAADATAVTIKGKVQAINASLSGGSANDLANMFVADEYNSSTGVGKLTSISNVKLKRVEKVQIEKTSQAVRAFNEAEANREIEERRIDNVNFDYPEL